MAKIEFDTNQEKGILFYGIQHAFVFPDSASTIKWILDYDLVSTQRENSGLVITVINCLSEADKPTKSEDVGYKCSMTKQKAGAMCALLFKSGLVESVSENHISYYSLKKNYESVINTWMNKFAKYRTAYDEYTGLFYDSVQGVKKFSDNLEKAIIIEDKPADETGISKDKQRLTEYLKTVAELDTAIYSLQRRYDDLHRIRSKIVKNIYPEIVTANDRLESEIADLENDITMLHEKINNPPKLTPTLDDLEQDDKKPKKPIFKLEKPVEPEYKKEGVFNKKKIQAENSQIRAHYEEDMLIYSQKLKQYEEDMQSYMEEMKLFEEEQASIREENEKINREKYEEELKLYNEKMPEYKQKLSSKESQLNALKTYPDRKNEILGEMDGYRQVKSIDYECEAIIKKSIEEIITAKKKLYSLNVVYGKYRNPIAISSFLDYLLSGRCQGLESNDGAYNLFEQESRADIIIGKMDDIIKSLASIRENQYYIYNQLSVANEALSLINEQLLVNNITNVAQIYQLSQIAENTDQIAYNTEVTAYYAKQNATYTKALVFLQAID